MSLLFKIKSDEMVTITEESDGTPFSSDSTETTRSIEGIELVHNMKNVGFDVGGDFTLNQLKENGNNLYLYYVETNYVDSFRTEVNAHVEYVEVFLTKEKADNLKEAVNIVEKAKSIHKEMTNKKGRELFLPKLEKLNERLRELGFEKDVTIDTRRTPLSFLKYKSENGQEKTLYISWSGSYTDLKHDDNVLELKCVVPELENNTEGVLTSSKKKKKSP